MCGRGEKRLYSATKFILYTAWGSIFLLIGVSGIGLYDSNESTLNFETLVNQSYPVALKRIFYIRFLIAFVVKSPIIPLHTWIPIRKTNPIHKDVPENTIFLLLNQLSGELNTTSTLISKIDEIAINAKITN
ncbi:hypothetical protein GQ457_05G029210 [Hibiscus cannabinus]